MTATDLLRLDVRAVLASGGEPFDLIMTTAARIPAGGGLELTAPFEPVPLYAVMRRRGFGRTTEARGPGVWVVTFRDTGISPTATLADIADRYPATVAVFGRHGLDLRGGGAKSLGDAAQARGKDLDLLLEELQAAANG